MYCFLYSPVIVVMLYNAYRFEGMTGACSEKFSYTPFGAGRHRCVGEAFAIIQIKTIWSTLLRMYEFELVDGRFPAVDMTTTAMVAMPKHPKIRYRRRAV